MDCNHSLTSNAPPKLLRSFETRQNNLQLLLYFYVSSAPVQGMSGSQKTSFPSLLLSIHGPEFSDEWRPASRKGKIRGNFHLRSCLPIFEDTIFPVLRLPTAFLPWYLFIYLFLINTCRYPWILGKIWKVVLLFFTSKCNYYISYNIYIYIHSVVIILELLPGIIQ